VGEAVTGADILARHGEDVLIFEGDDLREFCDYYELANIGDWGWLRDSRRVIGKRAPTALKDPPRIWIGEALGREWWAEEA
jgi:hypothetical protein